MATDVVASLTQQPTLIPTPTRVTPTRKTVSPCVHPCSAIAAVAVSIGSTPVTATVRSHFNADEGSLQSKEETVPSGPAAEISTQIRQLSGQNKQQQTESSLVRAP